MSDRQDQALRALQAEVAALRVGMEQLRMQVQQLTAAQHQPRGKELKALVAEQRQQAARAIADAVYELYDLDGGPDVGASPSELLAALLAHGVTIPGTPHSQKLLIASVMHEEFELRGSRTAEGVYYPGLVRKR